MLNTNSISNSDYNDFRRFLEDACGIVLGENKHYLVASRLNRLVKEFDLNSVGELISQMRREPRSGLRQKVIDAMTTNETLWFRDNHPYALLKDLIFPELAKQSPAQVRIWSAACSSGQEPYSISMIVNEYLQNRPGSLKNNFQVVATDISPSMLVAAKAGKYDNLSLSRGLSQDRRDRFFRQNGDAWEVRQELKARIQFTELNLMNSYATLGKFHIIFCRNVLIYFSSELKRDILNRLARALVPGGYLMVGATEALASYTDAFETVRHGGGTVYRLKQHTGATGVGASGIGAR